jgi:hypothetical protein
LEEMVKACTEIKFREREHVDKQFLTESIVNRDDVLERLIRMDGKEFRRDYKIV